MFNNLSSLVSRHLPLSALTVAFSCMTAAAQPANPNVSETRVEPIRELFVPFESLEVLLGGSTERVFVTREEFEKLSKEARQTEKVEEPFAVQILTAKYQGLIRDGRARLTGDLIIEVLKDGLQEVPLSFSGVGIQSAKLDGQAASLAQDRGTVLLFLSGRGRHSLQLELTLPVATDAARQTLTFQLPTAPANAFRIEVPGNVEVKSGASIVKRQIDPEQNVTNFDLLLSQGPMSIVMSLNNRKLRDESTVMARGVVFAEVTAAYERLHATMSMNVLNGATEEFRFVVDNDLEVYSVIGEELNRWSVEEVEGQQELVVTLQSPATSRVVLNVRLDRKSPKLGEWKLPEFYPRDVAGYTAVIGLVAEDRLRTSDIDPSTLIPIDASVLTSALPKSLFEQEAGKPTIEAIAAFYATNVSQEISAMLTLPPNTLAVVGKTHFVLSDAGLAATAAFTFSTENEKLFWCDVLMPASWKIESVKVDEGADAEYETFEDGEDVDNNRIRVQIPGGIVPGAERTVWINTQQVPPNWLGTWDTQSVELPRFSILGANEQAGIISLTVVDDLIGNPDVSPELLLLDEQQKLESQLNLSTDAAAYSYTSNDWTATIAVSRQVPRKTALVHSFLRVEPEILTAHYELSFLVELARTKSLQFSLPDSTPVEISILGLDGVVVKETNSSIVDGRRVWTVELAEKRSGVVRLAADFSDKIETEIKGRELPVVRAEQVDYQSGTVSVEGHPELDTQVTQHPRTVDVGELVDAEYQVGKRLLGAFGYVGTADETVVDIARRPVHGLPTTIVERAELFTLLSAQGIQQTVARYRLKTKTAYLEARLPTGAVLWAVNLDGIPALPHRASGEQADNSVIVALPADSSIGVRDLQIVYELTGKAIYLRDQVDMFAPVLFERDGRAVSPEPVPTADLVWEVALPNGYQSVRTNGVATTRFSIQWFLQRLWDIGGGKQHGMLPTAKFASVDSMAPQVMATSEAEIQDDFQAPEESRESPRDGGFIEPQSQEDMPQIVPQMPAAPQFQDANQAPLPPTQQSVPQNTVVDPWALEGVRSLRIDLNQEYNGDRVEFSSLGTRSSAKLTLVDTRRFAWGGWAVALVTVLLGLRIRNWSSRIRYLIGLCFAAMLVPVVVGWGSELDVAQWCVFGAAGVLAVWYSIRSIGKRIARPYLRSMSGKGVVTVSSGLVVLLCLPATCCFAQSDPFGSNPVQPISPSTTSARVITAPQQLADLLRNLLDDAAPISIPADAIVVPYNPADEAVVAADQQLWVPYKTYQNLLQQIAKRDDPRNQPKPSRTYALAGVNYEVVLDGDDSLQMSGQLTIDQFVDGDILIPLRISGCVLERASIDEQPARLHLVAPSQVQTQSKRAQSQQVQAAPSEPLVMLSTAGIGRKQLDFSLRFKLSKAGGWRGIAAVVPSAAAGKVTLNARRANTDIRFTGVQDRAVHETQEANEQLVFALPKGGNISLQWRDKIQGSEIDQGLTVRSRSVFDVQEDALRLAWQADFEFRRSRRESFTLRIPTGYLVERVVGANVRGWTVKQLEDSQQIDIELLKAAEQRESFAVIASKVAAYEDAKLTGSLPQVLVPSAMLHQGQVLVRRSMLLDVKTERSEGLSRMDIPTDVAWIDPLVESGPLPLKNYQAYEFSQPAIDLTLAVSQTKPLLTSQTQTLLKISQRETTFETRLQITSSQRDVHHLQVRMPKALELSKPEIAGRFEWSLVDDVNDPAVKTLNIYLANGLSGTFPLILRGTIPTTIADGSDAPNPIELPKFNLVDALKQAGAIVVQADPAYAIRAESLVNCESVLLDSVSSWLGANQRRLARVAIRYLSGDYSGSISVVARTPSVSSSWLSNVKVTDRAIEETILILAKIELAGIREFNFQLPASLANARIKAPLLRRKSVTPGNAPDDPVQVRLELQDAIMGQFMIVIEFDRLLTEAMQTVPAPSIETGATQDRFITLENASRDELVTEQQESLRKVTKIEFGDSAAIKFLNSTSAEMYAVVGAGQPDLQYRTKTREAVETAGARIGLAQTLLVVDEFGGYRGTQEYRVENRTEPFLEIELPENAQLWTVTVAGEPVKPAKSPAGAATTTSVRVPLIRTAEGDLDYAVVLKYGGTLRQFGWPQTTQFPFLQTTNISVELSQVRLRLPEQSRWFNFDGSVGRVETESDLKAGWLSFRTRQLSELTELLGTSEKLYSKARASNNLKALNYSLANATSLFDQSGELNLEVKKQLEANSFAMQQAQEQITKFEVGGQGGDIVLGNRGQVAEIYNQQRNGRSYNVVEEAGQNFPLVQEFSKKNALPSEAAAGKDAEFDSKWLLRNSLDEYAVKDRVLGLSLGDEQSDKAKTPASKPSSTPKPDMESSMAAAQPQPPLPGQREFLGGQNAKQEAAKGQITGDYRQQVERYNRRLQQNAAESSVLDNDLFGSSLDGRSSGGQRRGEFAETAEGAAMQGGAFGLGGGGAGRGAGGFGGEAMQTEAGGAFGRPGMGQSRGAQDFSGLAQRPERADSILGGAFDNESLAIVPNPQSFRSALQMGNGAIRSNDAAFMASLDVDLTVRGREFLFTTPGGQLELKAQSVSDEAMSRAITSAAIVAIGFAVFVVFRIGRQIARTRTGRIALALILFVTGTISIFSGLLPIYGMLCLLATLPILFAPGSSTKGQAVST